MREGRSGLAISASSRLRRFRREFVAALRKDWQNYRRYPAWVASEFLTTPLWFVLFALGVIIFTPLNPVQGSAATSGNAFGFFFWGFAFVIMLSTAIWGIGQGIRVEQLQGTIEQLFLAPINRLTIISGRWLRVALMDLVIVLYVGLLLGYVLGAFPTVRHPIPFLYAITLYELSILGFGLIFAAIALRLKTFNMIANLTQFGMILLAGVFYPVTALPFPLDLVGLSIPFTYYADLIRFTAIETPTLLGPDLEYGLLAVFTAGFLGIGYLIFRTVERGVKRSGRIGTH